MVYIHVWNIVALSQGFGIWIEQCGRACSCFFASWNWYTEHCSKMKLKLCFIQKSNSFTFFCLFWCVSSFVEKLWIERGVNQVFKFLLHLWTWNRKRVYWIEKTNTPKCGWDFKGSLTTNDISCKKINMYLKIFKFCSVDIKCIF